MGLFGSNAAEKAAKQARADEEARQARIKQGTASINQIFDGGIPTVTRVAGTTTKAPAGMSQLAPTGLGAGGAKTPGNAFLASNMSPSGGLSDMYSVSRTPDTFTVGGKSFGSEAEANAYAESMRTGGFGDAFFNKQRQAYLDYARPQVDDAMGKAREQLTYALARNGTIDSSIRTSQNADLQKEYDKNILQVTDKANEYSTNARNSVEDARANLISTLQITGDNVGASNAAMARAKALAATPSYDPIGQLFGDWTAGYAQHAAQQRAEALANGLGVGGNSNTGLFGTNRKAVKVTA